MVDQGKIVNVIIASPGDLENERRCIPELFLRWNSAHPGVHLEPLMCESGAVPAMGDHPQHILDHQIIERGDLLVALFWGRIGTPTPTAKSGTIEEIREFMTNKGGARVMLYFCNRPVPQSPNELDAKEIERLQEFRAEIKSTCLWAEFEQTAEFEKFLYQHLDVKVMQLLSGELPTPGDQSAGLSEDAWYDTDHADARLRKPIDFGNSLPEIAEGFSKRMDKFDRGDVIGKDKYSAMGVHVYWSVAQGLEQLLVVKPYDVPFSMRSKVQDIAFRLRNLSNLKAIESWPEFWGGGRRISDELNDLVDLISRNE